MGRDRKPPHGKWQRALLDALEQYDIVPVLYVAAAEVGREPTRAEQVAVRRAARLLAGQGRARLIHRPVADAHGRQFPHLCLIRPDSAVANGSTAVSESTNQR